MKIEKLKNTKALIIIIAAIIVLAVLIAVGVIYGDKIFKKGGTGQQKTPEKVLSTDEAGQKVVKYVNDNFLQGKPQASLNNTLEESGMYKVTFLIEGQENIVYLTRDGKLLFPVIPQMGIPINLEESAKTEEDTGQKSCEEIKKTDKAIIDAFVVSQCPYGLQMQRILAKVIKGVPSLKENIKIRYIGSVSENKITSMHGNEEAQENLRQICLREETDKYWDYVSCYMKKGETENCLTSVGVDRGKLEGCMTEESRGIKYAKDDFASANKFNVGGSPSLILNDEEVSEFWFGGRTADALKTLICCGFNTKPESCSGELSKDSAATGFSEIYASGSEGEDAGGCDL